MPLPAAAQRQIEEAERLHAEIYRTPEETSEEKSASAEVEPVSKQEGVQGSDGESSKKPEAPQGDSTATATEVAPTPSDDATMEARYKSLKGKYNAEIARWREQYETLRGENTELNSRLSSLESKLAEAPQEPTKAKKSAYISEEDTEEWGEEALDIMRRAAREEMAPYVEKLEAENARLKAQVDGVSTAVGQSARDQMIGFLDEHVSNWREINVDPGFVNWLKEPDTYSGMIRHNLLMKAFEANRAASVAAFFTGYLKEHAAVTPPDTQHREVSPKVDMASLVAPGRSRGNVDPRTPEGATKQWTNAQIESFYSDVSKGRYRGREKEKEKIERDIIAAANDPKRGIRF